MLPPSMHRSLLSRTPANARFKSLRRLTTTHHPFDEIPLRPLEPGAVAAALKSSRGGRAGAMLHALVVCSGLDSFAPVRNSLMNMYARSGSFDIACKIFAEVRDPDVVSWNTILSGFPSGFQALEFASRMHRCRVSFDAVSYTVALSFSADLQELEFGRQLHCLVFKSGFDADFFVGNSLITVYLRSFCVDEAKKVFDEKSERDLVTWNVLISGLTEEGNYWREAIQVFAAMTREEGIRLNHVSLASAVSACGQERRFKLGRQVHCFAAKVGLDNLVSIPNVLISMSANAGLVVAPKGFSRT